MTLVAESYNQINETMDQNKINETMLSTESIGQQLNLEKSGCAKN